MSKRDFIIEEMKSILDGLENKLFTKTLENKYIELANELEEIDKHQDIVDHEDSKGIYKKYIKELRELWKHEYLTKKK